MKQLSRFDKRLCFDWKAWEAKRSSHKPPSPSWRHERYWVDQASLIFYCLELFCRACFWKCLEPRDDHYFQGFRERTLTGSFLQSGCIVALPCNWSSLGFVQQTGAFCQWSSSLCQVRCFFFFSVVSRHISGCMWCLVCGIPIEFQPIDPHDSHHVL